MTIKIFIFLLLVVKSYALYADSSVIVPLNTENFDKLVRNGKEIWVVEFFAPWCVHCKNFASEYESAARVFDGIVKVGAVNADDDPILVEEYGVQGYPTVKIFNTHKGISEDYQGKLTASALVSFVSVAVHSKFNSRLDGKLDPTMFKSKETTELTETNFDDLVLSPRQMWLVVYFSPFSEKCNKLSSKWTKVAAELNGLIQLGALDATVHFAKASDCKIEGYPTIKFFPLGKKKVASGTIYSGKLKSEAIIQWALLQISENASIPEVTQIVDFESLKQACENKPLCVVSILPGIFDCKAICRTEYLDVLRKVSEDYKKALWGWVWSEAGAQPEIESALGLHGSGYPIMVAVNVKKKKYSVLADSSFSFERINEFLRDLSYGRAETKPITINKFPEINEIEPWDGLDAIPQEEMYSEDNIEEMRDEL